MKLRRKADTTALLTASRICGLCVPKPEKPFRALLHKTGGCAQFGNA
ncbi:MAG: hypothetical protein ABF791_12555 [Acetobacter sp.]